MNMRTIAMVPARGGSKGIPKKNIAKLGGYPLVGWPIISASKVPEIDEIYLSTDNQEIASVGASYGATVLLRPEQLAADESSVVDMVAYHLLGFMSDPEPPEIVVYLEPTSPFRTSEEITACIDLLRKKNLDAVATFAETIEHPSHHRVVSEDGILHTPEWVKIRERKNAFYLTGAVYVFSVSSFLKMKPTGIFFGKTGYVIQHSAVIDIDSPSDLEFARALVQPYKQNGD
jgi:N-acylneuraminate cytidylyltransferase